jgi:D-sedoheptulose 7-phosphate isomerase
VFSGRGGGAARERADHCVAVPGSATSTIQEQHIVLSHTLCECVEAALFAA